MATLSNVSILNISSLKNLPITKINKLRSYNNDLSVEIDNPFDTRLSSAKQQDVTSSTEKAKTSSIKVKTLFQPPTVNYFDDRLKTK